jgi:uncharacterized protein (TIGR02118 family)
MPSGLGRKGRNMILISVMYPQESGSTFDQAYYLEKHIPLVKARWSSMGLERVELVRGVGTPDGSAAPYAVMALLWFRSMQDFENAGKEHGGEIFADIPNFTNVNPVIQLNEELA